MHKKKIKASLSLKNDIWISIYKVNDIQNKSEKILPSSQFKVDETKLLSLTHSQYYEFCLPRTTSLIKIWFSTDLSTPAKKIHVCIFNYINRII